MIKTYEVAFCGVIWVKAPDEKTASDVAHTLMSKRIKECEWGSLPDYKGGVDWVDIDNSLDKPIEEIKDEDDE